MAESHQQMLQRLRKIGRFQEFFDNPVGTLGLIIIMTNILMLNDI